jgi:periplasmic copper chaperone A
MPGFARAALAAAFLLVTPAFAHDGVTHLGPINISAAFSRATLPNAPVGGGFLVIENTGDTDDRLVSATSAAAPDVQIHEMGMDGDVMRMRQLPDGLPIPAGETVTLAPGGYHLMFMQITQPFVEGETVPVTLTFEKAGTVDIELPVMGAAADAPAAHGEH